MENKYSNYYKNRSEKELYEVINHPNNYEDEARLAVYDILLQKNKELTPQQLAEKNEIQAVLEKKEKETIEATILIQDEEEETQEWYSPAAVIGFSVFLSPLFGAFLISYNLKKANKKNQAIYALLLGVLFFLVTGGLVITGNMNQLASILVGVIPAIIFLEWFWKKYLGYQTKYQRKSIWKVLAITLSFILFLIALQYYMDPEGFQEMLQMQFN